MMDGWMVRRLSSGPGEVDHMIQWVHVSVDGEYFGIPDAVKYSCY